MITGVSHALSIDIGGTFTDFSVLDLSTGEVSIHKVLTDPANPERALMDGATEAIRAAGADFNRLSVIVHSITLTTNSIIQRQGAKTGLITTEGFRDILEMGREQMYDMYDLHAQMPKPLVPRHLRRGVTERTARDGEVLRTLNEDEALGIVDDLLAEGVEALAVCLLHSYKNGDNERKLQDLVRVTTPGPRIVDIIRSGSGHQRIRANVHDRGGRLSEAVCFAIPPGRRV